MVGFFSHSITAGSVLGLAEELFGATPEAHMMAIRGYDFNEFGEWLSPLALSNLNSAMKFFQGWVEMMGNAPQK